MSSVRVRFAPSPTGYLHLGGARTALFNWLFARHHRGTFVLRIDDTDEQRSTEESMRAIFESMRWLGLDWDEGPDVGGPYAPYTQSERLEFHRAYAQRLLDEGKAYYCYCTKEELDAQRKAAERAKRPYRYNGRCRDLSESERQAFEAEGRTRTVRLKIEPGRIRINDLVIGDVVFEAETLDDFIIMKPNFTPLYNFSSAVDDHDLRITHVIRGSDHLSNTPKQILICRALGIEPPQFAHIPMVLNAQGKRLSKRDGAVSIGEYREMGFLPEAMVSYLVRLAWSAEDEQEIFTVEELIEKFDLDRVGKSPSRFDVQKLTWLNARLVAQKSIAERTDGVIPFLEKAGYDLSEVPREKLEKIVESVGDRLHTYADIVTYAAFFFEADDTYPFDPAAVKKWFKKESALDAIRDAIPVIERIEPFDIEHVESAIRAWIEETGAKTIQVLQPIRVAVSGKMVGPGLFEVLVLLGKEAVLARLKRAVEEIPKLRAATT